MRKFYLLTILLFIYSNNFAQLTYGNEWIDYSKKYIKIKINSENVYHLTYSDIINSGITSGSSINPQHFQLFNKGKEIALSILGAEDNSFDANDKILFYGKANDAELDKTMFSNENHIPNNNISLYEDNNYYFLTYNESKNGLRYNTPTLNTVSTPINYIIKKSRLDFNSAYYPGEYILDVMSLSEYIEGEGYMSNLISKGQTITHTINSLGYTSISNINSYLSFYVAGRSNSLSSSSKNHHFQIQSNGNIIADTTFNAYQTIRNKKKINLSGENTNINFSIIDDLGATTDYQALGYLELEYPSNLNLTNNNILKFNYPNQGNISLDFITNNINAAYILDIKNNSTYPLSKQNNLLKATNILNQSNSEFVLFDINNTVNTSFEKVSFRAFKTTDIKPSLIISNKLLSTGAEKYRQNNESIRNLPTTLAYTDELYNEFFYGFHHPLAINNFLKWAIDKGTNIPKSLLLLGKGMSTPKNILNNDLVPTYGFPASDNLLATFNNAKSAAIAVGRIPAKTNSDIDLYLSKLTTYENLPDSLWRKKIINVTGGASLYEYQSFTNYLKNLDMIAKSGFLGANTISFDKNVSQAVTENLTEGIIKATRQGANLLSFLGHGSISLTAVSLGRANDVQNQDKPTTYLINGCSTGDAFSSTDSYAENMILSDKGAISWIGTTSEGVASYLYGFSNRFYNNWFKNKYEESISEGFRIGIGEQTNASDKLNLAHSRQYIFIGDPNVKFHNPQQHDFSIDNQKVYANGNNQNAAQDFFEISYIIQNLGKHTNDSLEIKITRKITESNVEQIEFFKVKPISNSDTLTIKLSNSGLKTTGNNNITIALDPNNKFVETNKNNNTASFDYYLPGNGVNAIYPLKNSIAFSNVILKGQPDNLFTKNEKYIFEIDTVITFNSSFKTSSSPIISDILPEWTPNISFKDKQVYFWRVAIDSDNKQWSVNTFTYSNQLDYGQSISKFNQIINSNYSKKNIVLNTEENDFIFDKDLFSTTILTRGDDIPASEQQRRIRANPLNAISYIPVESTGITMVSYDKIIKDKIISYPSPYNSTNGPNMINGYTGQYFWNTNNNTDLDSLVRYINQLPEGSHVLGVNNYDCNLKNLPTYVQDALKSIGLKEFTKIGSGEPYMFWGKKGAVSGEAIEYTADYSSPIPARQQFFSNSHDLEYRLSNGEFTTDKFGPAKEWKTADFSYIKRTNDISKVDIYGVKSNNQEVLLSQNNILENINISNISAKEYPYLKFKLNLENTELRTIPTLNHWKVLYTPLTEITFNPSFKNNFHATNIQQGDSLKLNLGLSNLSPFSSDSLEIKYSITNLETKLSDNKTLIYRPINSLSNDSLKLSYATNNLSNNNLLEVSLKNKNYGDNYDFNNIISYTFNVIKDSKAPNIDILVDGKRIINGDIVSPKPIFVISSSDEDPFLIQKDTTNLEVYLKNNLDNSFKRIYYSSGDLRITEVGNSNKNNITVSFTPEKLLDGNYTIKVISKDLNGNKHPNDYLLDFEVINESTITNFYPYPNPVIDNMKFVFTLTGEKIPDDIKIQIHTTSGKIVREIFKEELGSIKIGNNISDFTWNGTDMFGDKLAKGVYFYKVIIKNKGEDFKHRFNKADVNFRNNIGKIYLIK